MKIKKISFNRPLISVQDIVAFIDKGEKYLIKDFEDPLEVLQAIILNPPYQREYRSREKEESQIIESILLNIPIPEVFLVKVDNETSNIRNVMDGKHRLNAIYRYVKNEFKLSGLVILDKEIYEGKFFKDLTMQDRVKILTSHISVLEFSNLNNDDLEIELFKRYNQQTKPLEDQEIRAATYHSKTSEFVSEFVLKEFKCETSQLFSIYNITKDRKEKQKVHQHIFTILSVLENGFAVVSGRSPELAEKYMHKKRDEYLNGNENTDATRKLFDDFNNMMIFINSKIAFPFSAELFSDVNSRNYKFQIGIAIYLAALYHYFEIKKDLKFFDELQVFFEKTLFFDTTYSGSSTNIKRIIADFTNYDFSKNESIIPKKRFHYFKRGVD
ncbi:DUF262 domain-containing protein [Fusibacter sp. JL298sf-3]